VANQEGIIKVLEETARSLKEPSAILRQQSHDLMKEANRIRTASKKAREEKA